MGHYDDAYEAEEEARAKRYKEDTKKRLKLLKEFRAEIGLSVIPVRFRESLEDLENWLKAKL